LKLVLFNDRRDLSEIVRPESMIHRQSNRRQPKLCILSGFRNMDVGWLRAFMGVEKELVSANSQDRWHPSFYLQIQAEGKMQFGSATILAESPSSDGTRLSKPPASAQPFPKASPGAKLSIGLIGLGWSNQPEPPKHKRSHGTGVSSLRLSSSFTFAKIAAIEIVIRRDEQ
jgi:hypothetical protein